MIQAWYLFISDWVEEKHVRDPWTDLWLVDYGRDQLNAFQRWGHRARQTGCKYIIWTNITKDSRVMLHQQALWTARQNRTFDPHWWPSWYVQYLCVIKQVMLPDITMTHPHAHSRVNKTWIRMVLILHAHPYLPIFVSELVSLLKTYDTGLLHASAPA